MPTFASEHICTAYTIFIKNDFIFYGNEKTRVFLFVGVLLHAK